MSENQQAESQQAGPWQWLACWLAVALTLAVSAVHTGVTSQWRDDAGLIRALGAWPLGAQGVVSTCFAQFTLVLPFGSRLLRAGLVSNLGAALACLAYFQLLHRLLSLNAYTPRLSAWLSLLGSVLLCLSEPMQRTASVAGGASVGFSLALASAWVHARLNATPPVSAAREKGLLWLLGALVVAAAFEQLWAGVIACVLVASQRAVTRRVLPERARAIGVGALVAAGLCCVTLIPLLRPHRSIVELPLLDESLGQIAGDWFRLHWGGVRWWKDAGALLLGAALLGSGWAMAKPRLRRSTLGWGWVLLLASIVGDVPNAIEESPFEVLRVAAFAAVVLLATLAAQTFALLLVRSRAAYVGGSVFVIPAFYGLMIAVRADEADLRAESAFRKGNDVFTQEALWTLPPNSILLLRTPHLAYRIWAERLTHGLRPDVLVITPRQLQHPGRFNRLLAAEPALTPLVRDWVLRGRPSEYVLSQLADTRPVFLELDGTWDSRIREHLSAWGVWLEYHSQGLGRSDRYAKMSSTRSSVDRVLEVCTGSVPPDRTTLHVVATRLKEQVRVLASLGDRPALFPLLSQLEKTGADAAFIAALHKLLDQKPQGALDWAALQSL